MKLFFWDFCCEQAVIKDKPVFLKKIRNEYVVRCPKCQMELENIKKR